MNDKLIPLGLLLFLVLFAVAMIREGRRQRQKKKRVFEDFAFQHGLRYLTEDDGRASAFAEDFDGVGRFSSSSLAEIVPRDLVSGAVAGESVILFRHSIRYSEGWAREWFVAGVVSTFPFAERCSVQFCDDRLEAGSMHLADQCVKEFRTGPYLLIVRAPSISMAGRLLDDGVLERVAVLAGGLSFQPEIQVRENRIIAYPADRNFVLDESETLENLLEFVRRVASL